MQVCCRKPCTWSPNLWHFRDECFLKRQFTMRITGNNAALGETYWATGNESETMHTECNLAKSIRDVIPCSPRSFQIHRMKSMTFTEISCMKCVSLKSRLQWWPGSKRCLRWFQKRTERFSICEVYALEITSLRYSSYRAVWLWCFVVKTFVSGIFPRYELTAPQY